MSNSDTNKYLPLSEATYYVMLALVEPRHGYGVMQMVEEISQGEVRLGAGTLYGVLSTLEKEQLIAKAGEEERRKYYSLTARGRQVLAAQVKRLEVMTQNGLRILNQMQASVTE
jgi:DNA-binding PadR family transcriptional regulator